MKKPLKILSLLLMCAASEKAFAPPLIINSQDYYPHSTTTVRFTYAVPEFAKGLEVETSGVTKTDLPWRTRSVALNDINYLANEHFTHPDVASQFGDGKPRDPKATAKRVTTQWIPRFLEGQPHGGLVVVDPKTEKRLGHVVAGGGDEKGASEVAYALMEEGCLPTQRPKIWGNGLGSSIVSAVVDVWAPMVYRIGHDPSFGDVHKAFRCFGEGPLERLDATASPANVGSWKSLVGNGFKAAQSRLVSEEIDLGPDALTPAAFELKFSEFFNPDSHGKIFDLGKRYVVKIPNLVDEKGNVIALPNTLTGSFHKDFKRPKLHFEHTLDALKTATQ